MGGLTKDVLSFLKRYIREHNDFVRKPYITRDLFINLLTYLRGKYGPER